jgi:hypothetical protein
LHFPDDRISRVRNTTAARPKRNPRATAIGAEYTRDCFVPIKKFEQI